MSIGATEEIYEQVQEAADMIRREFGEVQPADVGIVLGSGLGAFAEEIEGAISVPYSEIPHFPVSKVPGHAGKLWWGMADHRPVLVMQGRVHHYEGWKLHEVVFPIRVLHALGVRTFIITNAAGGVSRAYKPGNLVVIRDHINMLGKSPLRGFNENRFGPRFPDMTEVYDRKLRECAVSCLTKLDPGRPPQSLAGVYACMPGPQYETPAEVEMLSHLGVDLVGMSTVPEAIAARHMGAKVIGISCVTNMAAGTTGEPLSHEEVTDTGSRAAELFGRLLTDIVTTLPTE